MSQQEFENYLALLTRLLKVAPQQREQLAEEFRAHLEDRLDELLAGGMNREQAVHKAIGEFGDAASLAAELAQIAQRRRRRFLMKMSYAGVAALALVGLLVFALWPDGRKVQGPAEAVAQNGGQEKAEVSPFVAPAAAAPVRVPDRASAAHAKIQAALDLPAQFDFQDCPLKDFVDFIAENYNMPVILCRTSLEEAAISIDTPVTSNLRGISLRSAMRITLGQMKLKFVIWDEVLQITTPEDAESRMVTRVYDCRELLALPSPPGSSRPIRAKGIAGGGGFFAVQDEPATKAPAAAGGAAPSTGGTPSVANGNAEAGSATPAKGEEGGSKAAKTGEEAPQERELSDAENLIRLITTTVEPDSWDEVGGPGSIAEYKGLLVVSQTWEVHEKVERLLNMLHAAADVKTQRVKVVE